MDAFHLPAWLDGSLAGAVIAVFFALFLVPIGRLFTAKANAEGTLATQVVAQLKETNKALAEERAAGAATERGLREAHSIELKELREAHVTERKSALANATVLQSRVLDLSTRMVEQATQNAHALMGAVEKVREESRDGIQRLHKKLDDAEKQNQDCERRHLTRDIEAEARRRTDDQINAERDAKLQTLMDLVSRLTGAGTAT